MALLRAAFSSLLFSSAFALVQDLDDTFKDSRMEDVWLVDFYAPWCGYCKKLEPVWQEVGAELTRSGSPVRVGKMDATAYSGVASDFGVRGYPTIKLESRQTQALSLGTEVLMKFLMRLILLMKDRVPLIRKCANVKSAFI
uniref:protein disulfide-isomerase n=1 Tax=Cyprinus carpio carpio TaxID=630221 RepID=A0A9J7ZYX2_CYPCA